MDSTDPGDFTSFSGRFGNTAQVLTLDNLTVGESYTVAFDLFIIDSWDGNGGGDYFNVDVDGTSRFRYTFSNFGAAQSYPGTPDVGPIDLGFTSHADSIFRSIEVSFVAANTTAAISFRGENLQNLADESWGIDNVAVLLTSALPATAIRFTSLPAADSTNRFALDSFNIVASRELLHQAATNRANYSLREAGANQSFGDGDDTIYALTATHAGRSVNFVFNQSPLQPGLYRFESFSTLTDTNGAPVDPFARQFVVAHPFAGQIENTDNDLLELATALPVPESPPGSGFYTGYGAGSFSVIGDVDYWRFEVQGGDHLTVRVEADRSGVYPQVYLQNAAGSNVHTVGGDFAGVAEFQDFTVSTPGTYYLRVFSNNSAARYQLRVDQARSVPLETEPNDSQGAPDAFALRFSSGSFQAQVAGSLVSSDAAGDFYLIGTLNVGNSISVTLSLPAGSALAPADTLLSVQASGGGDLATSSTGSLNYTVTSDTVYYVRITSANRQVRSQYLLNLTVTDGVPPQVRQITLPAEGTTVSTLIDRFSLTFSEEMIASTVNAPASYDLRSSGADTLFDTADDPLYPVQAESYSGGLTANFRIGASPLQSGIYRFTIYPALLDRASNQLSAPITRGFVVGGVNGFPLENRNNNTTGFATPVVTPTALSDGTFSISGTTGAGANPYYVVAGHFDGNATLDVVSANYSANNVSVLLGNADGTFLLYTNHAVRPGPIALAAGDVNGDGRPDLAVANHTAASVTVLLSNGDGSFQAASTNTVGNNPISIALGNFNADSNLDLAVANSGSGNVSVLLGLGNGSFGAAVNIATGAAAHSVATADVTGDSVLDLVVANANAANVSVLRGNGDGSFAAAVNFATGGTTPRSLALGDLNGDSQLDVAVANAGNNTLGVLLGNGDGTFAAATTMATGASDPYHLILFDFNGDGLRDSAIANYGSSRVTVFTGNGDGTFDPPLQYVMAGNPIALAPGDFNADGRMDLATANYSGNNVGLLLGNATKELVENPVGSGLRTGAGRGNLSNTSDVDYWSFTGTAGHRVSVASETPQHAPVSGLYFRLETSDGTSLSDFYTDYYGTGQSTPITLPYTGTYAVRVSYNYDYQGEYRLRISTLAPPIELETEVNNSVAQADTPTLTLVTSDQVGTIAGYVGIDDPGDIFALGNLAEGTTINLDLAQPGPAGFADVMSILDAGGTTVASSAPGAAAFNYTLPIGQSGAHYARVQPGLDFHGAAGSVYALKFNGGSDAVNAGAWTAGSSWTVEAWVRPSSVSSGRRTIAGGANECLDWAISMSDGQFAMLIKPPGGCNQTVGSGVYAVAHQWYHLAATVDGTTARFYVNGELQTSAPVEPNYTGTATGFRIGNEVCCNGNAFTGWIDEVRVWNRALSAGEIGANRNNALAGTEPGLIGYWPFEEGSGNVVADLTGLHSGTLAGSPTWAPLGTFMGRPPGILAQYILDIALEDTLPPAIVSDTLPLEGTIVSNLVDRFSLGFSEDMSQATVTNTAHYELRNAGPDLTFGNTDDRLYVVQSRGYTAGLTASFSIVDGAIQPGLYRFTARNLITDRAGNSLTNDYVRTFSVVGLAGLPLEREPNPFSNPTPLTGVGAGSDGSLSAATSPSTGAGNPYYVVTGDFNNDTHADLAVAKYNSDSVTILVGDGTGNFASHTNHAAGNRPIALALGDVNGDTRLDLAVMDYSGAQVRVLLGNGDGSFAPASTNTVGANPISGVLIDLNGDGQLDLANANLSSDTVSVMLGLGTGLFGPRTNYNAGDGPHSIVAGDVNADGRIDLVTANASAATIGVLLGTGDGAFAPVVPYAAGGGGSRSLAVADFNGDGRLDVAVVNANINQVGLLLGNGDGTFGLATLFPTGSSDPYHLIAIDYNGDGRKDVAVANYGGSRVSLLAGNGDGTFQPAANYQISGNPIALAAADFNHDGRLDLATANYGNNTTTILLGNGPKELVEDPSGSGLRTATGRGNLSSTSDSDNWSFSGRAGDILTVALDIPGNPAASGLYVRVDNADGTSLTDFYTAYTGTGHSPPVTLPYNGTFIVRISYYYDYQGEYQLRVTTAAPPLQVETEDNNAIAQADTLVLTLNGAQQTAKVAGYISSSDSTDIYRLGNLADGTTIQLSRQVPASSALAPALSILNAAGAVVASSGPAAANVSFNVSSGLEGAYYAQVKPAIGAHGVGPSYALEFDASNDYVDLGNWFNLQTFTVGLWVLPSASQNGFADIIDNNHTGSRSWVVQYNNTGLQFVWGAADGGSGILFNLEPNRWQYLVLVRDAAGNRTVYLDGNVVGTTTSSGPINYDGTQLLRLGGWVGGGRHFRGLMDEVRIWDRALSGAEIISNQNQALLATESGLAGYWRFNEGFGTSSSDLSSAGRAATLVNGVAWSPLGPTGAQGGNLFAQYLLEVTLADTLAPAVLSINLPTPGSTSFNILDTFRLTFNEDMNPAFADFNQNLFTYNGHGYRLSPTATSWQAAELAAQALGGHLVTMNDRPENDAVLRFFGGGVWIGFNDVSSEGNFVWAGGEPVTFTFWNSGEPNNSGDEDFAELIASGRWNDSPGSALHRGVIEVGGTDSDSDGYPDTIDPFPNDRLNGVDLRAAGSDDAFGTADDVVYRVVAPGYTGGLVANFSILDGPLQAGRYRLTVTASLTDKSGNALGTPVTHEFTIAPVAGFILENRTNNTPTTGTSLSLTPGTASDGSFTLGTSLASGGNPYFVRALRLNNDTHLDLAIANYSADNVTVYLGNGNGGFVAHTNQPAGNGPIAFSAGHLNGDAFIDLAVADYAGARVRVLLGNGDGSFRDGSTNISGANPISLVIRDFDQNGTADLAVANLNSDTVSIYDGNGDGTFAVKIDQTVGDGPHSLTVGDFNGDGKWDLVTANVNSDSLSILFGNGDGSFAGSPALSTANGPRSVAAADVNGDGFTDIVAVHINNTIGVFRGLGDGTFSLPVSYPTGGSDPYEVILSDIDGNGNLDALVANYGSGRISVLANNSAGTFMSPGLYLASSGDISVDTGDFNGDGRMDIVSANYSANTAALAFGNPVMPLTEDPAGSGVRTGAGRGNLSDTSDLDYWAFSARAGDQLMVAVETVDDPAASQLYYRIEKPDGNILADFYPNYTGTGQVTPVTVPVNGTYTVRVSYNYDYRQEYRLRVTLARPPLEMEREENATIAQAQTIPLTLTSGHRNATVLGYISGADGADYYRLGFLSAGATVELTADKPPTSGLVPELALQTEAGAVVATSVAGGSALAYTVPAGGAGNYFARLTAASGTSGLLAQYFLEFDISDSSPPAVGSVATLPPDGGVTSNIIDRFVVTFSEELSPDIADSRNPAWYNGHAYLFTPNLSWLDAEAQAQAAGGHLVTINDANENEWITQRIGTTHWIGFTDQTLEGAFVWASGEPVTYTGWNSGEPNNSGNEDHATLTTSGRWNDAANSTLLPGVVEVSSPDNDGDGWPDGADPVPGNAHNYADLRAAGPDASFDTADDIVYHLSASYTGGLTVRWNIQDGPLAPGDYRLKLNDIIQDRFGNPMGGAHYQYFRVDARPGYVVENQANHTAALATPIPLLEDPPSLRSGFGRGNLTSTADRDFWSFNAFAGDRLTVGVDTLGNPPSSQLYYEVYQPNGVRIGNFYADSTAGWGQSPVITLANSGLHTVRVTYNYDYQGEYDLRISLATPPYEMETESNGTIASANAVTLATSADSRFGNIVGYIRLNGDLDYYNLGLLTNGSTVYLSTRLPASSHLVPVVSVYDASNGYVVEAGSGRPFDGVAEVNITQNGTYYALVRGAEGTGGLSEQYVLDVQVLPTGSVNFPNLQVTGITNPSGSIQSGGTINFSYTVQNVGSLGTAAANWSERVVLSRNTILGDADDFPLGIFPHAGALNPGESYTANQAATVPDGISGAFYLIVQTDIGNAVNEFVLEGDNITVAGAPFTVTLANYPDIIVNSMGATRDAASGVVTIVWQISNAGQRDATGEFSERLVVRRPATGAIILNTQWTNYSGLAVGAGFAESQVLSNVAAGTYQVLLTVDSLDQIFEYDAVSHASAELNTAETQFVVPTNTPPTISRIVDFTMLRNTTSDPIPFTIDDAETPPGNLSLSVSSANPSLISAANIAFGGADANRTLTISPAADQTGVARITLSVSDGSTSTTTNFNVTVTDVPAPTIATVVPAQAGRLSTLDVTMVGTSFTNGVTTVKFTPGITLNRLNINPSSTEMVANITVSAAAPSGPTDISVSNQAVGGGASIAAGIFTITNPVPALTGSSRFLRGLQFDGVDDYVNLGTVRSTQADSGTFEAWIKADTVKDGAIIDADSCGGNYLQLNASGNIVSGFWECVTGNPSSTLTTATALTPGAWYHIARTWTPTSQQIYINGTLAAETTKDPGAINSGGLLVHVGHRHSNGNDAGSFFDGEIDEVRIWDRSLAPREIADRMDGEIITGAGLLGYWRFNEGAGGTTVDHSGQGHTATVNGAAWVASSIPLTALRGETFEVSLHGNNFFSAATLPLFGPDVTVNSFNIESTQVLLANLTVGVNAAPGPRAVLASNTPPGGGVASLPAGLLVRNPNPTVISVVPPNALPGATLSVNISGSGFLPNTTTVDFGADIVVTLVNVTGPNLLMANISIDSAAVLGPRTVTVANAAPGGGSAAGTFTVSAAGVNTPPTIAVIADQTISEDALSASVELVIGDTESLPNNLQLSAASSAPALIPPASFVFSGTDANRTLAFRPAANESGNAVITVTVTDEGGLTAARPFAVTVTPLNDAPLVGLPGPVVSYTAGQAPAMVDATAVVSDSDNTDFGGGNLRVRIVNGGAVDDELVIVIARVPILDRSPPAVTRLRCKPPLADYRAPPITRIFTARQPRE